MAGTGQDAREQSCTGPRGEGLSGTSRGISISNVYGSMTHRAQTGGAGASVLPVALALSEDTQGFNGRLHPLTACCQRRAPFTGLGDSMVGLANPPAAPHHLRAVTFSELIS